MRVKNTLEYLVLWGKLNNPCFNGVEFDPITLSNSRGLDLKHD
jgi:hypothetical protein